MQTVPLGELEVLFESALHNNVICYCREVRILKGRKECDCT